MEPQAINPHPQCLFDGGGARGMPQLCADWIPNEIFWLIVALVVLYFIMVKVALPRIGAVLAERKETITNDLVAAEELKQKAQDIEKAYEAALSEARAEAAKVIARARAEVQEDLDAATVRADEAIAARTAESEQKIAEVRAGALDVVREVAGDTAATLVDFLGGKADATAIAAAVTARTEG